jgi:DNA mismatch endonuclease (patch repair protein)
MMARIRGRDTKPELALRRALRARGVVGYRCHSSAIPGRPDVAFVGAKLAIFVDGGFWHGHPQHFTFGKSGPVWDAKIRRNMERDMEVNSALFEAGWSVLRFWDFEIESGADAAAARIERSLALLRHRRNQ